MVRYLVLALLYPVLVGLGFQAWLGETELTLGVVGLTLILSSTIVFINVLRRK